MDASREHLDDAIEEALRSRQNSRHIKTYLKEHPPSVGGSDVFIVYEVNDADEGSRLGVASVDAATVVLLNAGTMLETYQRQQIEHMEPGDLASLISSTVQLHAKPLDHPALDEEHVRHLGPWVGPAEARQALGVSREALRKMRARRQLLGVRFGDGKFYYPARQFEFGRPLPGLKEVLDTLATSAPEAETWATWMAGREADLPMWALLRLGRLDEVLSHARADSARWAA